MIAKKLGETIVEKEFLEGKLESLVSSKSRKTFGSPTSTVPLYSPKNQTFRRKLKPKICYNRFNNLNTEK